MVDSHELLQQLEKVGYFICPIIRGRNNPIISVSIKEDAPIPDGWNHCNAPKGYYPKGTKRISLSYERKQHGQAEG
jgi:hypothetical protein